MTKRLVLLLSGCLLALTAACSPQEPAPVSPPPAAESGTVALTVWGAEEDEALLQEIFASFQAHYAGQAQFQITYQPQSESHCKDALLGDLEHGADVFAFADERYTKRIARILIKIGTKRRKIFFWFDTL